MAGGSGDEVAVVAAASAITAPLGQPGAPLRARASGERGEMTSETLEPPGTVRAREARAWRVAALLAVAVFCLGAPKETRGQNSGPVIDAPRCKMVRLPACSDALIYQH